MNIMGRLVGAAYMPPVATSRILRYTGQTARNGQDRSLQTNREIAIVPLSLIDSLLPMKKSAKLSNLSFLSCADVL